MMMRVWVLALPFVLWGQEPGIDGQIDTPKAFKVLYGNYDREKGAARVEGSDPAVLVREYAVQNATIDGKRHWILYTTAGAEGNDCHGCAVTLGVAVFAQAGQHWIKIVDQQQVGDIGSYGQPPECTPVQWGKQAYGLVVHGGWTGFGVTSSWDTLYGLEKGTVRAIFGIKLSDDNGGSLAPDSEKYAWEAEWSFGPAAPNGIYDIIVKMKTGNSFPKTKGLREGVPVAGVYRYDGSAYKHVQRGLRLKP